MGCDIHMYVEKRTEDGWVPAVPIINVADPGEDAFFDTPFNEQWYAGRNYDLFSILADVRNGYGFAGVPTGEGFVPIAEPRGVPADASPEYQCVVSDWNGDGHSHSWMTVRDLLTYDWTQTTKKTGIVSLGEYEDWTRCEYWGKACSESPKSYSGGIWGDNVMILTEEEAGPYVTDVREADNNDERDEVLRHYSNVYVKVHWEEAYYQAAGKFWATMMPRLCKLARDVEDWEGVRIVFFFDN